MSGAVAGRLVTDEPAASLRLLFPPEPHETPVLPRWNGNLWLLEDGTRPPIRTLTVLDADAESESFAVEVVLHGESPLCRWVSSVEPGCVAAVSGPARGTPVDTSAERYVLAGDESALPAMGTVLRKLCTIRPEARVDVVVSVRHSGCRVDLPHLPGAREHWLAEERSPLDGALVDAVREIVGEGEAARENVWVWAAGEASVMQRIRRLLFEELGMPRSSAAVRGYWKAGRAEE
ncbi:MAG: siderophore-interacting protein [Acidimicrobiales bacterium]|nr:MAG: siderophore-interacting protein [Acidimicrobiales bacterium]